METEGPQPDATRGQVPLRERELSEPGPGPLEPGVPVSPKQNPASDAIDDLAAARKKEQREKWKTVQTVFSTISLGIGLLAGGAKFLMPKTGVDVPPTSALMQKAGADVLPTSALTERERVELETRKIEAEEKRPRFDVAYLCVGLDKLIEKANGGAGGGLSYNGFGNFDGLVQSNSVLERAKLLNSRGESDTAPAATSGEELNPDAVGWQRIAHSPDALKSLLRLQKIDNDTTVVCLWLGQTGLRKALDPKLRLQHLHAGKAFELTDEGKLTDATWMADRTQTGAVSEEVLELNSLGHNEAVIIPLLLVETVSRESSSQRPAGEPAQWRLIRDDIFVPVELSYKDFDKTLPPLPIRKIHLRGLRIAPGLEARG